MSREAIILAGGLGTRLREKVPDLPKCLAPIAGQPFLTHIIRYLLSQGVQRFIFSLGYRHEMIQSFLTDKFPTLSIQYSIEEEPLGTGGAIKLAGEKATLENVLVINGDTLFKVHMDGIMAFHEEHGADCTLALKPMENIDRYGVVQLNDTNRIAGFKEKTYYDYGLINGGFYVLNVGKFLRQNLPQKFSFEKEYLETGPTQHKLMGFIQNTYFIDIGTPTDYNRAQLELMPPLPDLHRVNNDWTLFLDRDGVINHEKHDGYILNPQEFRFYDGVKEAFHLLAKKFGRIIVVSNQRGVGRGLMSEKDLHDIHQHMKEQIEMAGGRIDGIYYCTSTDSKDPDRKPNPGMALKAKRDFSEIEFSKSIIAGNKPSDMQFGRNAGMHTVFMKTTHPEQPFPHPDIDLAFNSLNDLAKAL